MRRRPLLDGHARARMDGRDRRLGPNPLLRQPPRNMRAVAFGDEKARRAGQARHAACQLGQQPGILHHLVTARLIAYAPGQEGPRVRQVIPDAAGDARGRGQPRAPPVIEPQHDRRIISGPAQPAGLLTQQAVRRPGALLGPPLEAGERQQEHVVQVGIVAHGLGAPRPRQQRDARLWQRAAQRMERGRQEEHVAEMVRPDEQERTRGQTHLRPRI